MGTLVWMMIIIMTRESDTSMETGTKRVESEGKDTVHLFISDYLVINYLINTQLLR